jgi:PPK2 family polyphosphate:nucleotide phosphotransferase
MISRTDTLLQARETPPAGSNLFQALIVDTESNVALGKIDPGYFTQDLGEIPLSLADSYADRISRLQYLMHAEGKHSLLIVLQGLDAAGKDGVVNHILRCMNPAGCRVAAFKQPTAAELRHDFLWRVHPHVPAKGEVAIFNRSHYEDVLFARVHRIVPPAVWITRYAQINEFERLLAEDNGTTVLKFFLHISRDEQLARFKARLDDPARHWKISESDYSERQHWDAYMEAFEDMLRQTSTRHAPWFVVPADNRWFRDLAISHVIVQTLEELKMRFPEPVADIGRIRRLHYAAEVYDRRW